MAASVVQNASGTANASTVSCTFASNVTNGNVVILGIAAQSTTYSSASDTRSTTFTSQVSLVGTNTYAAMVTGKFGSSGSDTVTVTMSASGWVELACIEMSGLASATVAGSSTGLGTTAAAVTSYTPKTNDFLIAIVSAHIASGGATSWTSNDNWVPDAALYNMLNSGPACGSGGECNALSETHQLSWTGGATTTGESKICGTCPDYTAEVSAYFDLPTVGFFESGSKRFYRRFSGNRSYDSMGPMLSLQGIYPSWLLWLMQTLVLFKMPKTLSTTC